MKRSTIPLFMLIFILSVIAASVEAAPYDEIYDDFPGTSYDPNKWFHYHWTEPAVGGDLINITNSKFELKPRFGYANVTFRVKPWSTTGYKKYFRIVSHSGGDIEIRWDTLRCAAYVHFAGGGSDYLWLEYDTGAEWEWRTITVVFDSAGVKFWYDGTYKGEIAPIGSSGAFFLRWWVETGYLVQVDWISVKTDRVRDWTRPTLSSVSTFMGDDVFGQTSCPTESWNASTKTLNVTATATGSQTFRTYVPQSTYGNYFVEVWEGGQKVTSGIGFNRTARELQVTYAFSTKSFLLKFVDPEPWMVNLYYALLPLGVDIAILLKWYDRLKAKHPALPWILFALFLILLVVAVWFVWNYLYGGLRL